jgi:hypothetical protein
MGDAMADGWRNRLVRGSLVVGDVVVARELPSGFETRVLRVIADASLEKLKQFCAV